MRNEIVLGFCSFVVFFHYGAATGISSKLDFGNAPKFLSDHKPFQREVKKPGDFEGVGIVCTSSGCNSTKENSSKDSLKTETDILVHVKTSVDLTKENKSSFLDETPDIPIVVGLAGTNYDDNNGRNFNPSISNFEDSFSAPIYPTSPTTTNIPFYPEVSSNVPLYPSTSTTPSYPPIHSYTRPSLTHSNPSFYPISRPRPYNPSVKVYPAIEPNNVYLVPNEPRIDININSLQDSQHHVKDIRYNENGLEMYYIPYFETSFNSHYFGERPPPQLLWYPKRPEGYNPVNPVEFKNIPKATWKPSFWNPQTTHRHNIEPSERCTCKNAPSGLQWNPQSQNPTSRIDDKLAPLN